MEKRFFNKLAAVADLIRLSKPYGTLLLMFPALWSLFIASSGNPPWPLIIIFTAGAFLMRSAGCAINDIADQRIDRSVMRTRNRPIASGRITALEGLAVFCLMSGLAGVLAFLLPRLAIILAVAGLPLVILYPYAKRFFALPQLMLGITFGWGALLAWASVRNQITLPALLIFAATVFWAAAYDTIYAIMDQEDDPAAGIKSTALYFGHYTWLAVGTAYALGLGFLSLVSLYSSLGLIYFFSLVVVAPWFAYHTLRIRKGIDHLEAFSLFKSNVFIGLIIFLGILIDLRFFPNVT